MTILFVNDRKILTACFVKSPVHTMIFDLPIVTLFVSFELDADGIRGEGVGCCAEFDCCVLGFFDRKRSRNQFDVEFAEASLELSIDSETFSCEYISDVLSLICVTFALGI